MSASGLRFVGTANAVEHRCLGDPDLRRSDEQLHVRAWCFNTVVFPVRAGLRDLGLVQVGSFALNEYPRA
jgi:hypothetical protein